MTRTLENPAQISDAQRLLRCRKTGRYFTGEGWTADPRQAKAFPDEMDAAHTCVLKNIFDVELVLRSPGAGSDLFATPMR